MIRTGEVLGHELLGTEVLSSTFAPIIVESGISSGGTCTPSFAVSKIVFNDFQINATAAASVQGATIKRTQVASGGAAFPWINAAAVKPSICSSNSGFAAPSLLTAKLRPSNINVSAGVDIDISASAIATLDFSSDGLGIVSTVPLLKAIVLVMRFDGEDMIRPQENRSMSRPADGNQMLKQADTAMSRGVESRSMEVS